MPGAHAAEQPTHNAIAGHNLHPEERLVNCARAAFLWAFVALAGAAVAAEKGKVPGTPCPAFPANSWWQADVSKLPVHARSKAWMSNMSPKSDLHADFGRSFGDQPIPYGIPITIVDDNHPTVRVKFRIKKESDNVRYPLGKDTVVEGGQYQKGDRHTVVVNRDTCRLYETYATKRDGKDWSAYSGATWDLRSNDLRPLGWTSADAAGLPILPGLLGYEEVVNGKVDHAIRFTTDVTDERFLWPARHQAGGVNDRDYPPMGARFRLKKSYDISPSLRNDTQAVLRAMKTYGLVLADNGSPWFFQGTVDKRWPQGLIAELNDVPAAHFEAVDTSSLQIDPDSMEVKKHP